ncbi:MAG: radical SAM protein [Gemmatimonadota bacterium]|jgi:radical SAM superfamily enzyme YgiQ (UPF0313 family)|nr:cobalamin B12-binding protein [Gemmatimonadota bacterium]MDP6802808.1 radical SAM protein [Gemmatimonadota bacterium]MDP7031021.1 radical SAM protein [Gemmatimonadota bacterium]
MRVTLIQPPQLISPTNYISTIAIPPLGLAYLASSLREAGHDVTVVDGVGEGLETVWRHDESRDVWLRGLPFEEIADRAHAESSVIGIGCMFSCQWPSTRELVATLRERFPRALLILGGEHASALPERTLAESPVDLCVLGEGEETLLEVVARAEAGENPADSTGLARRAAGHDGRVERTPPRKRIRDIDAIPAPAWDLFPVESYIDYGSPHGAVRGRSMPILATRGCPYQCTFCSSPQMWTTTWIPREPKLVVDEMEWLRERYGAEDFQFEDLTAVVKRSWTLEFCREVLDRKMNVTWQLPSGTRSEAIDREVADLMFAAGCRNFAYSVESGSTETLAIIKKRIHLDKVHASARDALAAGIRLQCTFILGFPHETWRHALATYREIARCAAIGFHEMNVCAFSPLPNTEACAELQRAGKIPDGDDFLYGLFGYMDITEYRSFHPRWGDRRLRFMLYCAFALFYGLAVLMRPWRLPAELFRYARGTSQGKLGKLVRELLRNRRLRNRAS